MQKYISKNIELDLYEHQIEGIEFASKNKKVILAHEMGLGKTRIAIVATNDSNGPKDRTLVVCPASLKTNWSREIRGVLVETDIDIIFGRKEPAEPSLAPWVIINYDVLTYHKDWIKNNFETIILDEAHYIKGKTIRSRVAIDLCKTAERVYCLTGTPMLNRPIELFNILKAIGHWMSTNRQAYSEKFCGAFWMIQFQDIETGRTFFTNQNNAKFYYGRNNFKQKLKFLDESGATNLDLLRKNLTECMIRRKKDKVLDLPPKIIDIQEVEMSKLQRKEYDNTWDDYIAYLESNPVDEETMQNILSAKQLVELTKLKQVCSRAKIDRIVEDALNAIDQNQKVIIFSQYTDTIKYIAEGIRAKKVKAVTLTGQDNQDTRQEAVDGFQTDPNIKAFVANIKAAGVGITLSKASIVMFADMDWSPEVHNQAIDRAHRIGQTRMINVHYYVCKDTIEEDIIQLLQEKEKTIRQIIDGDKKRVQSSSVFSDFIRKLSNRVIK